MANDQNDIIKELKKLINLKDLEIEELKSRLILSQEYIRANQARTDREEELEGTIELMRYNSKKYQKRFKKLLNSNPELSSKYRKDLLGISKFDLSHQLDSNKVEDYIVYGNTMGVFDKQTMSQLNEILQKCQHALVVNFTLSDVPFLKHLANTGIKTDICGSINGESINGKHPSLKCLGLNLAEYTQIQGKEELLKYDLVFIGVKPDDDLMRQLDNSLLDGQLVISSEAVKNLDKKDKPLPILKLDHLITITKLPERWLAKTLPSGKPWPKFSIVTPSYNQAEYIEETIKSVLDQRYPDFEFIVVDGDSQDGTKDILKEYKDQLNHCLIEKDKGQSDAINKGFKLATGDIFAWLNSDDVYCQNALLNAALAFDRYECDMIAGGCKIFLDTHPDKFWIHHNSLPVGYVTELPVDKLIQINKYFFHGDFFVQPEVFWTRGLWERCGAYLDIDLYYAMDYELWMRMAERKARIAHIPDTLVSMRKHVDQKTDKNYGPELRKVASRYKKRLNG